MKDGIADKFNRDLQQEQSEPDAIVNSQNHSGAVSSSVCQNYQSQKLHLELP